MKQTLLYGIVASLMLNGNLHAADVIPPQDVAADALEPVPHGALWSGFYAGAHAGIGAFEG